MTPPVPPPDYRFEVFVQRGFDAGELTGVTNTLKIANHVVGAARFGCRIVSDCRALCAVMPMYWCGQSRRSTVTGMGMR